MKYRICATFAIENGHILSKHKGNCRFPHGHSRQIEIVVASHTLDENDMVCDFEALEALVWDYVHQFDHALCVNSTEKLLPALQEHSAERIVVYENQDPTTEVMTAQIFRHIEDMLASAGEVTDRRSGLTHRIPPNLDLERVRVWETKTNWAEVTND